MHADTTVGAVLKGKISGIMKFGAFVDLENGDNGLLHISQISDDYVENVSDFLKKGQPVTVKVVSIEGDKVGLSMKGLNSFKKKVSEWTFDDKQSGLSFEEKMSRFMKDSNEKYAQLRSRDNKRFNPGKK